jgi:hypothetical protein
LSAATKKGSASFTFASASLINWPTARAPQAILRQPLSLADRGNEHVLLAWIWPTAADGLVQGRRLHRAGILQATFPPPLDVTFLITFSTFLSTPQRWRLKLIKTHRRHL